MIQGKRQSGSVALDLANTVDWRDDPPRRHDHLTDFDALVDWFARVADLDDASVRCLRVGAAPERARALQATVELREALHTLLTPNARHRAATAAIAITRRAARALASAHPDGQLPLDPRIELRAPDDLVHRLALDAFALATSPDAERVKTCEGEGCGWLFLDRSRNQSRRWCDSADCGNRARMRRYYLRHRDDGRHWAFVRLGPGSSEGGA